MLTAECYLRPAGNRLEGTDSCARDTSGLLCGFEDVRLHPELTRGFDIVGAVVKEEGLAGLVTQRLKAMAIDGWIGLGSAKLARPDLDLEFVEPFELAANIGQQVVRHVGEDGDAHSVRLDLARKSERLGI